MMPVRLDYADKPRRTYGDRLGFFRGVWFAMWITAGIVSLLIVLLTSH